MDVLRKILTDAFSMMDRPLEEIEEAIRAEYAGSHVYIRRDPMRGAKDMSARDRALIRDWNRGESPALLSRRYRITLRRVYQILERHMSEKVKSSTS